MKQIITISGKQEISWDGFPISCRFKVMRFVVSPELGGLTRRGMLYRTFDSGLLAKQLGFINAKITTTISNGG